MSVLFQVNAFPGLPIGNAVVSGGEFDLNTASGIPSVPEPASIMSIGIGLVLVVAFRNLMK